VARSRKQFPLRIPPDLFAVYEAWAADEFRSIHAQIEAVLMDAARRAGRLTRHHRADRDAGSDGASVRRVDDDGPQDAG
jgi:hypothetical protein